MDQTEFLFPFPENIDEEQYKQAKTDYIKIRKYLLRLTSDKDFEKGEKWKKFKKMTFYEYLFEVGMFESG